MSNHRRFDDDDRPRPSSHRHSGRRSGRRSRGGNFWWWIVAGVIAYVAYTNGDMTGTPGGGHHIPSHRSTVCTQYYKGGC